MSERDPWIGRRLGKFQINGVLGKGGMGVVYEGFDPALNRPVAIKVINGEMADLESLQRFSREARATARLNHPNIVTVYDAGVQGNVCFLAMELVHGPSAQDRLERGGPIPWREAARIVIDICRGLELAHGAGLVHRDIKPANIMLAADGTAKLGDFGMVKAIHTRQDLTRANTVLGTPLYMSPEQCRAEDVDDRSDQYALAATFFTLLTGRPPFQADDALKIMFAHCSSPPPDPRSSHPELPVGCTAIVQRAMAKNRSERFKHVGEFRAALEWLVADAPPSNGAPTSESAASQASFTLRPVALAGAATIRETSIGNSTALLPNRRFWPWIWAIPAIVSVIGLAVYVRPWSSRQNATPQPKPQTMQTKVVAPSASPAAPNAAVNVPWRIDIQIRKPLIEQAGLLKAFTTSANGSHFAAAWTDGKVRVWTSDENLLKTLNPGGQISALALSADGSLLVVGIGKDVTLWDIAKGEQLKSLGNIAGDVTALTVSRENLLAVGTTNELQLWRLSTDGTAARLGANLQAQDGPVWDVAALAFSGDGRWLAIACRRGVALFWDVANLQQRAMTVGTNSSLSCIACSPDGQYVAFGSFTGGAALWRPLSGDAPLRMTMRIPRATVMAFDPRGRYLLLGGGVHTSLFAYDYRTTFISQVASGPNQEWRGLNFLDDGKTLAGGDENGTVRTWAIDKVSN